MPSVIEGYNYDIFISYRQKDNKHDGWVTEFVNQLKGELEATFKEDISIYFDENPHDGLLETHNVDKSLEDKLKCLIFIPIISQTYCDPKSFAWEHEFKAFNKLAKEDSLGKDVKLASGNVASRILPVKIHDLDQEDRELIENELGEVLRGIEFIYKEAGVNRPLKPDDDAKENLNKTNYRNQINKVANAVKEIVTALKKQDQHPDEISHEVSKLVTTPQKSKKTSIIISSAVALALIVFGILFIPNLFRPSEELEKSIAVLPFRNDSPDQEMYFINGVMEEILDNLCKIEDIRVVSRSSVEQYRDKPKPIPVVAEEMDVGYVLEGSGQRDGDNIRLTVQLLDARRDQHIWSETYYREIKNIFELQSEIAQAIASELKAIITPSEKELIEKIPTTSISAFDFYQRGNEAYWRYWSDDSDTEALERAKYFFNEALKYDSTLAQAYTGLARIYWGSEGYLAENYLDTARVLLDKALSFDTGLAEAYTLKGKYFNELNDTIRAIREVDKAISLNPNDWEAYSIKADISSDYINKISNRQKAVLLNRGPELPILLDRLGYSFWFIGFNDKAADIYEEVLKLTGDSISYLSRLAQVEWSRGNFNRVNELGKEILVLDSTLQEANYSLFISYSYLGEKEQALKYGKIWVEWMKASGRLGVIFMHRIGYYYWLKGLEEEADYYFNLQIEYSLHDIELQRRMSSEHDLNTYYNLAATYAFTGETEKALDNLRIWITRPVMDLNMLFWIRYDVLFNPIRNNREFQQILNEAEAKYQAEHERVRKWLEEQEML